jgi:hypothetical protein
MGCLRLVGSGVAECVDAGSGGGCGGWSEDRPAEQGGEHGGDQDADDGLVVQCAVGEGESGDEQRDGEADAGEGGASENLPEPDAGREPTRTDTHARP